MAKFCLIPQTVTDFRKALKDREIDPLKLSMMESRARRDFLEKYVGKDAAPEVNSLFESKLLLKNQKAGYISWAKKVGGITPEVRRDLQTKIEKLDRVLNPEEEKAFLNDLANTKLGTEVTLEEAKKISELSHQVQETKAKMQDDFTFKTDEEKNAYGKSIRKLQNYVNELKGADKITIKSFTDVPGIAKSMKSSLDDSAIFRQGWKTLFAHPIVWAKNAVGSFSTLVREFGGKEVLDEIMADKESRQNNLNGSYKKMGLAVGREEEAYPTSIPEKIPILGRAFKASETAYTGFVYKLRMDIADKYLQIAKDQGTEMTDKELKSIGSLVNSLTGRGNLGKYEGSGVDALNSVFFSPRNIKSQFDTLGHVITGAGGSNFVRRQAAKNLVKVAFGIATIMTIANTIRPGSAETDPRSSDFGKIKVGDTRFDITGGIGSMITLAARIVTQSTKSSSTGNITPINSGDFGAKTGKDVVVDYLTNKLAPVGQVVIDLLNQQDRNGDKLTPQGELGTLGLPLPIATYQELQANPKSADTIAAMIADGLGISTNTYSNTEKDWIKNPTKEQQAFLDKMGEKNFKDANGIFNERYGHWIDDMIKNKTYKNLTSDQQSAVIKKKKDNIQKEIFKEYHFKYKQTKKSKKELKKINDLAK